MDQPIMIQSLSLVVQRFSIYVLVCNTKILDDQKEKPCCAPGLGKWYSVSVVFFAVWWQEHILLGRKVIYETRYISEYKPQIQTSNPCKIRKNVNHRIISQISCSKEPTQYFSNSLVSLVNDSLSTHCVYIVLVWNNIFNC